MGFLENFDLKEGTGWMAAAQAAPALIGAFQANKARRDYNKTIEKIEEYQRQDIINPYQNLSNPYQNLAVATKGAQMQIEQSDLALANTLDAVRKTGAGGATALAQAALQSKQGVAASIEKQEVANQKLQAKGQLQVDVAKAKGEAFAFGIREDREQQELDRLQKQADIARAQQIASRSGAISALGSGLESLGGGLIPGFENIEASEDIALKTANKALTEIQDSYDPIQQLGRAQINIGTLTDPYNRTSIGTINLQPDTTTLRTQ